MKTRLGTPMYMAPEIHDKTVAYQGQDADCFAFGVSLFVARVIGYPWKVPDLIKDKDYKLFAGDYGVNAEQFWETFADRELSCEFKDFMETILACVPSSRPTMADMLGAEWMRGETLTKEKFEAECAKHMDAAVAEKATVNEEFGIDHAVERKPRRGDAKFEGMNFVTREFRPHLENNYRSNMKQFVIEGKPIGIMDCLYYTAKQQGMEVKLSDTHWKFSMQELEQDQAEEAKEKEPFKMQVELHEID